jgi:small redox-active disulfide protein 2
MNIKVLAGGCCKCENLLEAVKEAVAEKGIAAEIEYITDMAKIMEYGIMSTPALMVDNKIVSMGRVLKAKDVLQYL